jgi:hypothetical protein
MTFSRKLASIVLVAVSFSLILAACERKEAGEKIIIEGPRHGSESLPLYAQPGGLGETNATVNLGEFARILDRKEVGADVLGATPEEWVKIRTIIQPREGWLRLDNTRPAPKD